MSVTKEYIGWSESLAARAAGVILSKGQSQRVPGGEAIDLSNHRIIVPSRSIPASPGTCHDPQKGQTTLTQSDPFLSYPEFTFEFTGSGGDPRVILFR